ncbi:hypothetical protein [Spiroplasma endosymbiont of Polydrusus pterygomalis]
MINSENEPSILDKIFSTSFDEFNSSSYTFSIIKGLFLLFNDIVLTAE